MDTKLMVADLAAQLKAISGWTCWGKYQLPTGTDALRFTKGGCLVLVAHELHKNGRWVWHLSISRKDRYPGWNEIKDARYALLPEQLTFCMIFPPPAEYISVHDNCFHLWEIDPNDCGAP